MFKCTLQLYVERLACLNLCNALESKRISHKRQHLLGLACQLHFGVKQEIMESVIEKLAEFLGSRGWKCSVEADRSLIQTGANGKNGRWPCIAIGGSENRDLVFLSLFPVNIPTEKRPVVAELLARINYRLSHGCYEMDFEDGELRFRTSIPAVQGEDQGGLLEYLVFANLCTFDNHFGTIMKVLYTEISPKKALEKPKAKKVRRPRFELN
jgi:hypothetical protein